jgi:2'-5' RNA ligase
MSRWFYGVEVPMDLKQQVGKVQRDLQTEGVDARNWSDPALFHLTVLFLGELSVPMSELDEAGSHAAHLVPPLQLTISELGAFPRNRVLWLGVENDEGMRTLTQLHHVLRKYVAEKSIAPLEERPFRAHLTLARQVQVGSLGDIEGTQERLLQSVTNRTFSVESLCLFESTRQDGKLVYPVRRRYALSGTVPTKSE